MRIVTIVAVLALAIGVSACSSTDSPGEEAKNAVQAETSCQSLTPVEKEKCENEYKAKGQGGEETKNREAAKKEAEHEAEEIREGKRLKEEGKE